MTREQKEKERIEGDTIHRPQHGDEKADGGGAEAASPRERLGHGGDLSWRKSRGGGT